MSERKYKISYAKKKEAKDIIALVHEVIGFSLPSIYSPSAVKWFYDYHSVEHIEEEFDGGALVATVYDGHKLIGTGTYYDDELKRLFIHPGYQRAGIGKMIVDDLEKRAIDSGRPYIMLYANPATWKYYAEKGYEPINFAAANMEDGQFLAYCMMTKNFLPKGWVVEPAEISDAEEILHGQKKAFLDVAQKHTHMDMPPMTETVGTVEKDIKNISVFVAKAAGKIIGSVRGEEKNGAGYVSRLWVLPEYQGKGIGHALMYAVEDAYGHLPKYELFTGSKSEDTLDFYKEREYVETRREACMDYELVFMEKINAAELLGVK